MDEIIYQPENIINYQVNKLVAAVNNNKMQLYLFTAVHKRLTHILFINYQTGTKHGLNVAKFIAPMQKFTKYKL